MSKERIKPIFPPVGSLNLNEMIYQRLQGEEGYRKRGWGNPPSYSKKSLERIKTVIESEKKAIPVEFLIKISRRNKRARIST